jgi:enoyl-[acyl-carrier protein] reductase II
MELIVQRKAKEISHAQYAVENFWVGALRRAIQDGDVESGSVMAGQSIGLVNRIRPLHEALESLIEDTRLELARVEQRLTGLKTE